MASPYLCFVVRNNVYVYILPRRYGYSDMMYGYGIIVRLYSFFLAWMS
jgi:hypothetical protein